MTQPWGVPPQSSTTAEASPRPYGFQSAPPSSPLGLIAMILGIFAMAFCWSVGPSFVFAIPAIIVSRIEMGRIRRGEAPESNRGHARLGFWCGVVSFVCSFTLVAAYVAYVVVYSVGRID
jgi:hypothetical protein